MPAITGTYSSLAVDNTTGYSHISYHDDSNTALKYASYNGTAWNLQTLDSGVGPYDNVGMATSLALDATGYPHISYNDWTNRDLKYASYNGTAWNIQTVDDSADEVGRYTSLALDGNGYPHISYYKDNDPGQRYLKYASYDGTAWNIQRVTFDDGGSNLSLALDSCGYPHISYLGGNTYLQYASFIPAPGLAVSKGGSSVSKVGDNITYWVAITNTGDVPLQKVSVSDNRSGVVTDISGWFSATLAVGASENYTYTYTVQAGDPSPLLNTVTAVYGGTCFSNLSVSDNHSVTLVNPSIEVAKTPVNPISKVGDDVTFTITIENTGDCPLIRDSVSDNLSVFPDPNTYAPFYSIPASSSVSGNFTYTVQDTDPDPLVNLVTVHYHPDGLSNVISDNATCTVDLRHPNILVTKGVAAGIYRAGDNITYLLSINNTSTDITLVKDSVTDSLAGDITSLFSDNITAGGSDNQTYTYTVKATDPDPLVNDVTANYHPEGLTNDIFDSTYANVFLAPTITSITPNQGSQGQTLNIVITGSQLNRVSAVDFGAGITVNSITVDGPTQITVNISINPAAAPGPRDVTVTNPTGSDILIGGFTVQQLQTTPPSVPTGRRASPPIYTSQGTPGQAQIELQYLSVRPQQTMAGQPVTITTNVVNTGNEAGNYNVVLKINGQAEQTRTVSVGAHGTQPVKFTTTKAQPGAYTVNIGDQKANFIVTGAGRGPGTAMAEGILFAAAMAVIAILVVLLIIVARRRSQGY